MNNIIENLEDPILPGAEPFTHINNEQDANVACLLLHGFTASPQAMRGLGSRLKESGISHYAPLLLGHGTDVKQLDKITWAEQEAFVEKVFEKIAKKHKKIVLIGESSGGSLALHLAAKHPDRVSGVVTVCGAVKYPGERFIKTVLPVYKRIRPYPKKVRGADVKDRQAINERVAYRHIPMQAFSGLLKYSKQVIEDLPKLTAPLLILQTLKDHAVAPKSADIIYQNAGSNYKQVLWYPESYHILLIDYEKEKAFTDILDFVKKVSLGA